MADRIHTLSTIHTAPELEQFLVATVQLTGRVLGAGAYGSVEEVEIPGATVAAKKLHQQLVNLGSPQQVNYIDLAIIIIDQLDLASACVALISLQLRSLLGFVFYSG